VADEENKGYIGSERGGAGETEREGEGKRRRSRAGRGSGGKRRRSGMDRRDGEENETESSPLEHREESTAYFMGSFSGHIVVLFPII